MVLLAILIGVTIGVLPGLLTLRKKNERKEKEETTVIQQSTYLPILREAFRSLSPNSRGRGSVAFLNLSTAIQKIEEGGQVDPFVLVYILSKIDGGLVWADQIKKVGA